MHDIDHILRSRNVKPTAMRLLVLRLLAGQNNAVSLSDLEAMFEKVDKVTLYRTLKTFEENLIIHTIHNGSGSVLYALCSEGCRCHPHELHVHFMCTRCGRTFCLKDTPIPALNLPDNFTLQSINMVVKGMCPDCA